MRACALANGKQRSLGGHGSKNSGPGARPSWRPAASRSSGPDAKPKTRARRLAARTQQGRRPRPQHAPPPEAGPGGLNPVWAERGSGAWEGLCARPAALSGVDEGR